MCLYSTHMAKKKRSLRTGKLKLSFAEEFFPQRPQQLVKSAGKKALDQLQSVARTGTPNAKNTTYVNWLKRQSMLHAANVLADKYVGQGSMWQNPFAKPRPRSAIRKASVWYTAYPASVITEKDKSIIATLADDELWQAFQKIGITGLHTGPMKQAGGLNGWQYTPSIDGHFDRISNKIDVIFGTEQEFIKMSEAATRHNGIVVDDIVPGHTGKGPDFRLAEMKYRDYPGIYHMVEIDPDDTHLLPDVPAGKDSVNINAETEAELKRRGYIIGKLQRVIFFEPGVKETNWSATRPIVGTDGVTRRWVYLHYFKSGQPSLNWLDPSLAAMKLVIGDAIHSLGDLGASGLRLDANGFLGVEKTSDEAPAWSEGHPLSEAANLLIAGMVRKLGGFTFQELNLSFDDIKSMATSGADLSYDFINRPAYHHALATNDTEFLRLCLRSAHEYGIDPASLVHALQNHDDLTFELVHFWTRHKDDMYYFRGDEVTGAELREVIRNELLERLTGKNAPYNMAFTTNGIACTSASVIAASLGLDSVDELSEDDINKIKQVHLLLVMFNAFQPGVFALSGWDLCGSLPLKKGQVEELVSDGDTRWVSRGSYDLMNVSPAVSKSTGGMPKAQNLYGTLPEQLDDRNSFVCRLQKLLQIREEYQIATSQQIDIPDVPHRGLLVMVHKLHDDTLQLTILNFSPEIIAGTIFSEFLPSGAAVIDMFEDVQVANVDDLHTFGININPYQGMSLHVRPNN
jgi:trehalose synthase